MKTEKAIKQDREFIAQVVRSLPNIDSEIKQGWIENQRGLKKILGEALCPPREKPEFKIWKTIKLGTHQSADDFRKALKKGGNIISDWADDVLGKPEFEASISESKTEINLCVATVKELTGKDYATTSEIFDAIKANGYELCPAEIGPQLRLQYKDQPKDGGFRIAMEPITDSDGDPAVFCVGCSGSGLWLGASRGESGDRWDGHYRWAFSQG